MKHHYFNPRNLLGVLSVILAVLVGVLVSVLRFHGEAPYSGMAFAGVEFAMVLVGAIIGIAVLCWVTYFVNIPTRSFAKICVFVATVSIISSILSCFVPLGLPYELFTVLNFVVWFVVLVAYFKISFFKGLVVFFFDFLTALVISVIAVLILSAAGLQFLNTMTPAYLLKHQPQVYYQMNHHHRS
jgi:hypothetical protein